MRYCLTIQYDGTDFCGWQAQKNGISVQQTVESALKSIAQGEIKLVGSGRTDSGVHAYAQVAHVDMETRVPAHKIKDALNAVLPVTVKILKSELAPDGFHARYSAKRKTYIYKTYLSDVVLPLKERYSLRLCELPDLDKMREGAKKIVGVHDFKCFLASNSSVKDTVREVYELNIQQDGDEITFSVCGNGFLYNMVRTIVGTLLKIEGHNLQPEVMKEVLEAKNRAKAGQTVSPYGLTLVNVDY